MGNTIAPNGVNTFDWDENDDPSVTDTNWYYNCLFMVYRCKSSSRQLVRIWSYYYS